MTDSRATDTTSLNAPTADDLDQMLRELAGEEAPDRQDGLLDPDQVDVTGGTTDTDLYEGGSGPLDLPDSVTGAASVEMFEDLDLRSDETSDANIAAEEGLAWIPPSDPPVVPSSDPQGIAVAAGFASSARDEPYDTDHHQAPLSNEDEMTQRVREALRADAATTEYADRVEIETDGDRVILRGVVVDLEDDDNLVAVASTVTGVAEVVDHLEVAGL